MESESLGTKQIEKILSAEINNWLRWGRNRDYLPISFRCPLGYLYVPKRGDLEARLYKAPPINSLVAVEFERLVVGLPVRHRQAFVMYHLNRARIGDKIIERKRSAYDMAKILAVQKRQFEYLVSQAHNMVYRRWKVQHDVEKNIS